MCIDIPKRRQQFDDKKLGRLDAYRENSTKAKRIGREKNERVTRAADEVVCARQNIGGMQAMIRTEKPQRKEVGNAVSVVGASTISTRDFITIIDAPSG